MKPDKNRVGLGTFPLADVFTKITPKGAKRIVHEFIENGGFYIDTAPMYGFGGVEKMLGEVLGDYPRDQFYIATKCMYVDVEGKTFQTIQKSGKYKDVLGECERSLERLRVDSIDLYFTHSPDPNTPIEETMSALEELQKQGKIKEIGVSNVNLDELKEYNKNGKVKFVQNRLSLINRSVETELEEYMMEHDIKLVPYQVIERGQLSGKVNEGFGFRKDDLRNGKSDWEEEPLELISNWVKAELSPIANELGITIGQLAIAWALRQKHMGFVIAGATNVAQMKVNLEANGVGLDEERYEQIEVAYRNLEERVRKEKGMTLRKFRGLNEKYY